MDLREYLRVLRARWLLVSFVTLAAIGLAALATLRSTPEYTSTSSIFVSTNSSNSDGLAFAGGQFTLGRVNSYVELIKSKELADRVIKRLDLDESPEALAGQISAEAKIDTVVLDVTATDPSPQRAKDLVDAVSEEFVGYVSELETPPGKDESTVKATITDAGSVPGGPVSPQPTRNLLLGAVLGFMLGAGIAVLRETLDRTVKNSRQLETLVEAPLLGSITFDKQAVGTPLISSLDTYAPRAEAFRVLRTNLQFIDPDVARKVFVITSSLPGEGKTTTAVNLALALAEGGEKVALVEGDLRRPMVSEYLRLESTVGLTTVLLGRLSLADAFQHTSNKGLDVLTSGSTPPNPAELLKSKSMAILIDQLRESHDVVLIDAPPLLPVTDGALLAAQADGALLVVRHGKTTTDQVAVAVSRLRNVGAKPVGVIFNMTPAKGGDGYGYGYGYGYAPDSDRIQDAQAVRLHKEEVTQAT